nr:uncharacterized protein LOC108949106 isoform X1 [Nicotiana tomentosiformis]
MVESVISINSFSKTMASWDFKMIKMLNTLVEGPLLIWWDIQFVKFLNLCPFIISFSPLSYISIGVSINFSLFDVLFCFFIILSPIIAWSYFNFISGLFAQKKNSPCFWQMLREIIKFKQDVITYLEALDNNSDIDRNETLGYFIQSHGYSELFQKAYLFSICASIWFCPSKRTWNGIGLANEKNLLRL